MLAAPSKIWEGGQSSGYFAMVGDWVMEVREESKCCNFRGASYIHPQDIALRCQKQIVEFVVAGQASIPLIHDQPRPPEWDRSDFQIWQKPADGWMKFNCDGAWTQAHMKGGARWVARDSNGWMEMAGGVWVFVPVGFGCGSGSSARGGDGVWRRGLLG
ncbi:hypothetical protein PRUPE_4G264300 [Prunus persica]|uniref:RNase H type-1 domain-containing protein n=1 Tax=Prunus persica TaxID=3760 RepID=A0A251PST7_PRUPE|nr:hypothetical protein PRUPE_4G264300 [Prunus persica]